MTHAEARTPLLGPFVTSKRQYAVASTDAIETQSGDTFATTTAH